MLFKAINLDVVQTPDLRQNAPRLVDVLQQRKCGTLPIRIPVPGFVPHLCVANWEEENVCEDVCVFNFFRSSGFFRTLQISFSDAGDLLLFLQESRCLQRVL